MPSDGGAPKPSARMATIGSITFPTDGFEAVIFDCDGTLVDSMPAHFEAWCDALAIHGAGGVFRCAVDGVAPVVCFLVDISST